MADHPNDPLQIAGINVGNLRKGDFFTVEQVLHASELLNPKLTADIERFRRGELSADPLTFIAVNLAKEIEKQRLAMGIPVVCKTDRGGIRVLQDSEAVTYLNNQAESGLRKHKSKTSQLFNSVDTSQLSEHDARELSNHQRKHAFVLAAHQGARTQSLRMARKGLELPDVTKPQGDS